MFSIPTTMPLCLGIVIGLANISNPRNFNLAITSFDGFLRVCIKTIAFL